jgi:AraC-like DNA-binding protein
MGAIGPEVANVNSDTTAFDSLAQEYRTCAGVDVCLADTAGTRLAGQAPACEARHSAECPATRRTAMNEATSWGEPTVGACPARKLVWAVPVMANQKIVGGLVACVSERRAFTPGRNGLPMDVRRAATDLRLIAEKHNMTNASALELKRRQRAGEQKRAFAIQAFRDAAHHTIRELYLREEPALFSAIRSGDRPSAREILNRILVAIHQSAGDRLELVKSYFLELVVSMCRTAVESGVESERLLGASFQRMTELAAIHSEEMLAPWLVQVLENLMDEIESARVKESPQRLFDSIAFMQRHCCERITRDDAARAAHLSGSHFSYLLRRDSGATFTDLLNRMRVDRAAELLVETDKPLSIIAVETGFNDQSYFTKVFKRHRKIPPLEFRKRHVARIAAASAKTSV